MIRSAEHLYWEAAILAGRVRCDVQAAMAVGRDFDRHMERARHVLTTRTVTYAELAASVRRLSRTGLSVEQATASMRRYFDS